jgi:hypothetical protein
VSCGNPTDQEIAKIPLFDILDGMQNDVALEESQHSDSIVIMLIVATTMA